jgi:hypothetical protein
MLTYGAAVAVYLAYLGLAGGLGGILLWPAVALHVVLAILLVTAWRRSRQEAGLPPGAVESRHEPGAGSLRAP